MPIKLPVAAQCTDWYQCYGTQVNKEDNFSITSMIHESDYSYFDLHSKTNLHAVIFLPNALGVLLGNILKLLWIDFCGAGLEIPGNTVQTDSRPMQQGRPASLLFPMPEELQSWDEGRCQRSSRLHQRRVRLSLEQPIAVFQLLPTSPRVSPSIPHKHTRFYFPFFLLAGDTLSAWWCITVIHLLLKCGVAFRLWHFELLGRKNVTLTTNFEVCFLNAVTVYSLLLFLGHFKLP